jgi:hypothetical protein
VVGCVGPVGLLIVPNQTAAAGCTSQAPRDRTIAAPSILINSEQCLTAHSAGTTPLSLRYSAVKPMWWDSPPFLLSIACLSDVVLLNLSKTFSHALQARRLHLTIVVIPMRLFLLGVLVFLEKALDLLSFQEVHDHVKCSLSPLPFLMQ